MTDTNIADREYRLARALVEAHVPDDVASLVLESLDNWNRVVSDAREVLRIAHVEQGGDALSVADTARILGCSTSKVYRMIDRGELPESRVGRSIRIPSDAVQKYRDEHTTWHPQPAKPEPRRRRPQDEQNVISQHGWLEAI